MEGAYPPGTAFGLKRWLKITGVMTVYGYSVVEEALSMHGDFNMIANSEVSEGRTVISMICHTTCG